jgi:hypothetical protein
MVSAERNFDESKNGRRSRGPSPNGHLSDDSSATDDSDSGKRHPIFFYFLLYSNFINFEKNSSHGLRRSKRFIEFYFSENGMRVGEEFQAFVPEYNAGKMLLFLRWPRRTICPLKNYSALDLSSSFVLLYLDRVQLLSYTFSEVAFVD